MIIALLCFIFCSILFTIFVLYVQFWDLGQIDNLKVTVTGQSSPQGPQGHVGMEGKQGTIGPRGPQGIPGNVIFL